MDKETKLKIGQKRTKPQRYQLKRVPINHMSPKRKKESPKYRRLLAELIMKSGNKSDYSGSHPDFRGLQVHHIYGRTGKLYLDVFNLIVVTADEHEQIHGKNTAENKERLKEIVREIRLKQGYKDENNQF